MGDKRLLSGSGMDDLIQFTFREKGNLYGELTGRVVFRPVDKIKQYSCRPYHTGICFCFTVPIGEISPGVCLPGTPLSAQVGEQVPGDILPARVEPA